VPEASLITPVRDRPRGFELCERWISSQSFDDFEWIVVDDGVEQVTPSLGQEYVRREPTDKLETQSDNILAALDVVRTDRVVIVEDDDWRGPRYLETLMVAAGDFDVVTNSLFRTYYLKDRSYCDIHANIKRGRSYDHHYYAGRGVELLRQACVLKSEDQSCSKLNIKARRRAWRKQNSYIQSYFWPLAWGLDLKIHWFHMLEFVSIKQIPGRFYTMSHIRPKTGSRYSPDPSGSTLRRWVGEEDADLLFGTL